MDNIMYLYLYIISILYLHIISIFFPTRIKIAEGIINREKDDMVLCLYFLQ